MKQYLDLLQDIKDKGSYKAPARHNMPSTTSLFGTRMEFDLAEGFPLLTTKKVYYKGIFTELIWFLRGDTNIKYLVDRDCNIWNQDAYRWYVKYAEVNNANANSICKVNTDGSLSMHTYEEFVKEIVLGNLTVTADGVYTLGDLGKVYGAQWRNQNGVDQLANVINGIKANPESRYHIINAWNASEFKEMALPPCHILYQFNCREDGATWVIDLQMYQRSCDTFLGVPFNIASGAAFLCLIAEVVDMDPGKFIWVGGDTHIYEDHLEAVEEQLTRMPLSLPMLAITKQLDNLSDLEQLDPEDLEVRMYSHHPAIKAKLSTGL